MQQSLLFVVSESITWLFLLAREEDKKPEPSLVTGSAGEETVSTAMQVNRHTSQEISHEMQYMNDRNVNVVS